MRLRILAELLQRKRRVVFALAGVAAIFSVVWTVARDEERACFAGNAPMFSKRLDEVGYLRGKRRKMTDSIQLEFVSNSVLVGTLCQLSSRGEEPTKLFSVNVDTKAVSVRTDLPIDCGSEQLFPLRNGQFLFTEREQSLLCDETLQCRTVLAEGSHSINVSPSGNRLVFEGRKQTTVIETKGWTTEEVVSDRFDAGRRTAVAGDEALVVRDRSGLWVERKGGPARAILAATTFSKRCCRFVDAERFAALLAPGFEAIAVVDLDGQELYRVPVVVSPTRVKVLPAVRGGRFVVEQSGYTTLNRLLNPFDIDSGRPFNLMRLSLRDSKSGRELANYRCDPAVVAISPDGRRLATEAQGELRVFELPVL